MADLGSFVVGAVVGGTIVLLLVTSTGREVTGRVARAGARRVETYVAPG